MKKRALSLLVLFLFILVTGCSGRWQHPTKPRSAWGQDHAKCEQLVRESIREAPDAYGAINEHKLIKTCMKKMGWYK
jgi:hypothetical protein